MAEDTAKFVITGEFDPSRMIQGVDAAMGHLNKTITGRMVSISKDINKAFGGAIKDLGTAGGKAGAKELNKGLGGAKKHAIGVQDALGNIKADIFIAAKRVLLWGAASRLVFESFSKIKSAITDIIKLNQILVNIQKIRPEGLPIAGIEANIIQSAKQYGVAFEEIGETQRTFFQQGFKAAEVLKLTEAQLLGVTAAGLSATESIELLIGSMSIFNIAADKSLTLIDKLQKVQANYAVSTVDLATAIKRVGPVVEQLGGDIDHLIGIITALKESTRKSGEFIGTALSTIFSRIVTPVGAKALRGIGISINKSATELRPLRDIVNDLAVAWKNLSTQEKFSVAFALGARRRYAQVVAMLNTYDTALEASASSMNAFGASIIAQQKEVKGIARQFAIARETIRATGIAIVRAFAGGEDTEKGFARLAKGVQYLANSAKNAAASWAKWSKVIGGATVLIAAGAATGLLGMRIAMLVVWVKRAIPWMLHFSTNWLVATKNMEAAAISALRLRIALQSAFAVIGIGLAVTSFIALGVQMRKNTEEVYDLSEAYTNFSKKGDDAKATLQEYFAVAKKFREIKGPEALRDFLGKGLAGIGTDTIVGQLRSMEGVSNDLNNVTFDQFVAALQAVRGTAADTEGAIEDLANVIGLFEVTQGGIARVLETFESQMVSSGVAMKDLIVYGKRMVQTGNEFGPEGFFGAILGKDPKGLLKTIGDFSKVMAVVKTEGEQEPIGFETQDIDKIKKQIAAQILGAETGIGLALRGAGGKGKEQAEALAILFLTHYFTALNEKAKQYSSLVHGDFGLSETSQLMVVKLGLKFSVDEAAVTRDVKEILNQFFSPEELQKQLENLRGQSDLLFYESLMGTSGADVFDEDAKKIAGFLTTTMPKAFKAFKGSLIGSTQVLKNLQEGIKRATEQILYFPKALTSTEKSILKYNTSWADINRNFEEVGLKARALGKTLLNLQATAVSKKISEGIKNIVDVKAIPDQIRAAEDLKARYEDMIAAYTKGVDVYAIYGLKVTDIRKKVDNLGTSIKDLEASQATGNAQLEETIDILNENIFTYNKLISTMLGAEAAYKRTTTATKGYSQAFGKLGQMLVKFSQQQAEVVRQFDLLGKENDFSGRLSANIDKITKSYKAQNRHIIDQQKVLADTYSIDSKALRQRREILKTDVIGLSLTEKELAIVEGMDKAYGKQAANAKIQAIQQFNALEYEKERLQVQEQMEKRMAAMNTYLAIAKKQQSEINDLASGYASSVADIVTNINDIVTKRGGLRQIVGPFADAYVQSVTSRLASTLEELFQSIAGRTIGSELEKIEAKIKSLESKGTALQTGDIIKMKMIEGAIIAGEIIATKMIAASKTPSGGIPPAGGAAGPPSPRGGEQNATTVAALNSINVPLAAIQISNEKSLAVETDALIKQAQADAEKLRASARLNSAIQGLGLILGGIIAGSNPNAQLGSQAGGMLGSILGPVGSVVGSVVGAVIGSFFKSDKEDKADPSDFSPEIYNANTEALKTNTEAILRNSQNFDFMRKLINAPSNFILPSPATLGGGAPLVTVNINSPVGSAQELGDTVYDAVSRAYNNNSRRIGRRG